MTQAETGIRVEQGSSLKSGRRRVGGVVRIRFPFLLSFYLISDLSGINRLSLSLAIR